MRVAFITKEFTKVTGTNLIIPGGSAQYRCLMPQTICQYPSAFGLPAWTSQYGFGIKHATKSATFGFNTAFLKLLMDRWVPHQVKVSKELGQRIIVDVDDHYDGLHENNHAFKMTDPSLNKVSNREYYKQIIELADTVTVSTPFLYEYYKERVADVRLVRNSIDTRLFPLLRKHVNDKPFLGWAGAMQWRSNDAETAQPWLNEFLKKHDLMFHHSGHMPDAPSFAEQAGVDEDRLLLSPMKPMNEYYKLLDFDIGLVFLSDIPFNQAKSALKGMEYAAANIPFVAYATEEYKWLADQGIGRVATNPDEWEKHLTELLDYKTRKREAAVNRRRLLETQSITVRAPEWQSVFSQE